MKPGCALVVFLMLSARAQAFPYLVQPGDTTARIAERMYGDGHLETVVAAANGLDRAGGLPIAPGMRLELPADLSVRVQKGDTWASLAARYLGSESHATELAAANQAVPWVPPDAGQDVRVFAVLTHVAGPREFVSAVAKRYGMEAKTSWKLSIYNKHDGDELSPGEVLTVPLAHLTLTESGRAALRSASESGLRASGGEFGARPKPEEATEMLRRVRAGEWASAAELAQRFAHAEGVRGLGARALGYRVLLEVYAATGERARAQAACMGLMQNAKVDLSQNNATSLSPVLRVLCIDLKAP